MSFEIHMTTIATGSLSFGLKNRWVFLAVEFFRAWVFSKTLKKKACSNPTCDLSRILWTTLAQFWPVHHPAPTTAAALYRERRRPSQTSSRTLSGQLSKTMTFSLPTFSNTFSTLKHSALCGDLCNTYFGRVMPWWVSKYGGVLDVLKCALKEKQMIITALPI